MSTPNVLVTPTLLDKFEFLMNSPPSWRERATIGFLQQIRREPGDFPLWVRKGMDFENAVYKQCNKAVNQGDSEITVGSKEFQQVANACLGGKFQQVFKREVLVDGEPVLYYCKLDVLFPNKVIDIKTTLEWKGDDKYLKGWQHIMYLWLTELQEFAYIVAVWQSENADVIKRIHTVEYNPFTFGIAPDFEYDIVQATKELFSHMKNNDMWEDYYYKFSNNRR